MDTEHLDRAANLAVEVLSAVRDAHAASCANDRDALLAYVLFDLIADVVRVSDCLTAIADANERAARAAGDL